MFVAIFGLIVMLSFKNVIAVPSKCEGSANNEHARLRDTLLCDYDNQVRPKMSHGNSTNIAVKMLLKFITFSPTTDTLSVSAWFFIKWEDDHLKWTPKDYGDIEGTHLGSDSIWTPDLSLYNGVDHNSVEATFNSVTCTVSFTGQVSCLPPMQLDGQCIPDLTNFPFDTQTCLLRLGSWVHSGEELNLTITDSPISLDEYLPNGYWKLISVTAKRNEGIYDCCPNNTFPSIVYKFVMERHSTVYICTIVVPALTMFAMTLAALCMEPTSADRICLICANFICHYLFIQYLSWEHPLSGLKPPLVLLYVRDSSIMVLISLIVTVVTRNLNQTVRETPYWMSSAITSVTASRVGTVILFLDASLQETAAMKREEDGTDIIERSDHPRKQNDWRNLARILDRVFLLIFCFIYFCKFIGGIM